MPVYIFSVFLPVLIQYCQFFFCHVSSSAISVCTVQNQVFFSHFSLMLSETIDHDDGDDDDDIFYR